MSLKNDISISEGLQFESIKQALFLEQSLQKKLQSKLAELEKQIFFQETITKIKQKVLFSHKENISLWKLKNSQNKLISQITEIDYYLLDLKIANFINQLTLKEVNFLFPETVLKIDSKLGKNNKIIFFYQTENKQVKSLNFKQVKENILLWFTYKPWADKYQNLNNIKFQFLDNLFQLLKESFQKKKSFDNSQTNSNDLFLLGREHILLYLSRILPETDFFSKEYWPLIDLQFQAYSNQKIVASFRDKPKKEFTLKEIVFNLEKDPSSFTTLTTEENNLITLIKAQKEHNNKKEFEINIPSNTEKDNLPNENSSLLEYFRNHPIKPLLVGISLLSVSALDWALSKNKIKKNSPTEITIGEQETKTSQKIIPLNSTSSKEISTSNITSQEMVQIAQLIAYLDAPQKKSEQQAIKQKTKTDKILRKIKNSTTKKIQASAKKIETLINKTNKKTTSLNRFTTENKNENLFWQHDSNLSPNPQIEELRKNLFSSKLENNISSINRETGLPSPEDFKKSVAQIYKTAPFVSEKTFKFNDNFSFPDKTTSIKNTNSHGEKIITTNIRNGLTLLSLPNYLILPQSFKDEHGNSITVEIQQDSLGNQILKTKFTGQASYELIFPEKPSSAVPYELKPQKEHSWSKTTEKYLELAKSYLANNTIESEKEAIQTMLNYRQTNGLYTAQTKYLQKYASTPQNRDQFMIYKCTGAAQVLAEDLSELGFQVFLVNGFSDNGDGNLTFSERHQIVKVILSNWEIAYLDATPNNFLDQKEKKYWAENNQKLDNPLAQQIQSEQKEIDLNNPLRINKQLLLDQEYFRFVKKIEQKSLDLKNSIDNSIDQTAPLTEQLTEKIFAYETILKDISFSLKNLSLSQEYKEIEATTYQILYEEYLSLISQFNQTTDSTTPTPQKPLNYAPNIANILKEFKPILFLKDLEYLPTTEKENYFHEVNRFWHKKNFQGIHIYDNKGKFWVLSKKQDKKFKEFGKDIHYGEYDKNTDYAIEKIVEKNGDKIVELKLWGIHSIDKNGNFLFRDLITEIEYIIAWNVDDLGNVFSLVELKTGEERIIKNNKILTSEDRKKIKGFWDFRLNNIGDIFTNVALKTGENRIMKNNKILTSEDWEKITRIQDFKLNTIGDIFTKVKLKTGEERIIKNNKILTSEDWKKIKRIQDFRLNNIGDIFTKVKLKTGEERIMKNNKILTSEDWKKVKQIQYFKLNTIGDIFTKVKLKTGEERIMKNNKILISGNWTEIYKYSNLKIQTIEIDKQDNLFTIITFTVDHETWYLIVKNNSIVEFNWPAGKNIDYSFNLKFDQQWNLLMMIENLKNETNQLQLFINNKLIGKSSSVNPSWSLKQKYDPFHNLKQKIPFSDPLFTKLTEEKYLDRDELMNRYVPFFQKQLQAKYLPQIDSLIKIWKTLNNQQKKIITTRLSLDQIPIFIQTDLNQEKIKLPKSQEKQTEEITANPHEKIPPTTWLGNEELKNKHNQLIEQLKPLSSLQKTNYLTALLNTIEQQKEFTPATVFIYLTAFKELKKAEYGTYSNNCISPKIIDFLKTNGDVKLTFNDSWLEKIEKIEENLYSTINKPLSFIYAEHKALFKNSQGKTVYQVKKENNWPRLIMIDDILINPDLITDLIAYQEITDILLEKKENNSLNLKIKKEKEDFYQEYRLTNWSAQETLLDIISADDPAFDYIYRNYDKKNRNNAYLKTVARDLTKDLSQNPELFQLQDKINNAIDNQEKQILITKKLSLALSQTPTCNTEMYHKLDNAKKVILFDYLALKNPKILINWVENTKKATLSTEFKDQTPQAELLNNKLTPKEKIEILDSTINQMWKDY